MTGCYGLLGILFIGISTVDLITVIQFYLGHRRDLYFANRSGRKWDERARHGIGFLLVGISILLTSLLGSRYYGLIHVTTLLILIFWFTSSFYIISFLRPAWVRELETGRSTVEIQRIHQQGTKYLERFPKTFPLIINNHSGWDVWIMTVI